MMTKFWDKLSEGLADSWNTRLLLPGAAFLVLGVIAITWRIGVSAIIDMLTQLSNTAGIILVVAGLFFIVMSGWLVQRLTLPVLRLFEGYWPWVFGRLSRWIGARFAQKVKAQRANLAALAADFDNLTPDQRAEYTRLDSLLPTFPQQASLFLPTRLGNLLRASEEYPNLRYGLEMSAVWPRLWLLLPETTREEIGVAREALDTSTRRLTWGIACTVWVIFAWWTPLVAVVVAAISYWSMLADAAVYCDLLRAAFDLHRVELYKALRWELPSDPDKEVDSGKALTEYLHRGSAPQGFRFKR